MVAAPCSGPPAGRHQPIAAASTFAAVAGNQSQELRLRERESEAAQTAGIERFQTAVDKRLLHRLACSPHRRDFVLKGAMLFTAWTGIPHRATRDLDLLGSGTPDLLRLALIFRTICAVEVEPDGVTFEASSVVSSRIREDQLHEAVRVLLTASVGSARINVQVDIGFGDAVHPAPVEMTFPTILEQPAPRLLTYPRQTVVAEKFHAMVSLGLLNSRMKDFFDLVVLSRQFAFAGPLLGEALAATFSRRQTELPEAEPVALRAEFAEARDKQVQWAAFVRRNRLAPGDADMATVVSRLRAFIWPVVIGLHDMARMPQQWPAGGPWS